MVLSINRGCTLINMPQLNDEQCEDLPGIFGITLGALYGSSPWQYVVPHMDFDSFIGYLMAENLHELS